MILQRLAPMHKLFQKQARVIAGEKGDDLLQSLYMHLHTKNVTKILTMTDREVVNYMFITLRNRFYNDNKKRKLLFSNIDNVRNVGTKPELELDDKEVNVLNNLSYLEREILYLRGEKSLRQIAKITGTSYFHIFTIEKKAKERIKSLIE